MKKLLTLSFLVMFLIGTDTFLVSPLLPALSVQMSFPIAQGGWLVSAYAIGYCVAAIIIGPLSDELNRRNVLITGVFLFSIATMACAAATSFSMLLILRFITGICAAIGSPQIWAIIPQLVHKDKIAAVMSAPTAGLTIATMLGVPIGSFLSARDIHSPFLAVGGASFIVTVALALLFPHLPNTRSVAGHGTTTIQQSYPENNHLGMRHFNVSHLRTHSSPSIISSLVGSYHRLFMNPQARPYFLAYFIFQIGNFAVMTFIATWFAQAFGLNQTQIGLAVLIIGVGNCIGAFAGPLLTSRLAHGKLLLAGFCIYLAVYACLASAPSIVVACILLSISYMVSGAIFPLFIERLQSLTTSQRGTVSTLSNITMYAGSTVAGFVGGPAMAHLPGFWGISILAFLCMLMSLLLWYRSKALTR